MFIVSVEGMPESHRIP